MKGAIAGYLRLRVRPSVWVGSWEVWLSRDEPASDIAIMLNEYEHVQNPKPSWSDDTSGPWLVPLMACRSRARVEVESQVCMGRVSSLWWTV